MATLLLAQSGVHPKRAANDGCTPLCIAAQNGHAGMAALLLADPGGVDPSQANSKGRTPLIIACHMNHPAAAALLLDHGAIRQGRVGGLAHSCSVH